MKPSTLRVCPPVLATIALLSACVGAPSDSEGPADFLSSSPQTSASDAARVRHPRIPGHPHGLPHGHGTPAGALSGYSLYVEPDTSASAQADAWRGSDPDAAFLMDEMAAQPAASWIGDWTSHVTTTVDDAMDEAGSQLRVFTVYNIPNRDCGAWSSGGTADAAAYAGFIGEVAAGLAGRDAVVILEPDALPLQTCLDAAGIAAREAMLAAAVDTLTAAGGHVYIDAGDSNWISATDMASRLASAGVANAAGFALNVSHTETTADSIGYAEELRAILGDVHYVVDTSRNGVGSPADNEWCNPPDRALGANPTLNTGVAGEDALLWIKRPGESDGACNGGPDAGAWWADYALDLALNAVL